MQEGVVQFMQIIFLGYLVFGMWQKHLTCTCHVITEDTFGSLEEKKTISILRCDHKLDFPEGSSSFLQ